MRSSPLPLFILFLLAFSQLLTAVSINAQDRDQLEYIEAYSVRGDTLKALRNNSLAFKTIMIKFITFLNRSYILINCSFSDGNRSIQNNTVSAGYYTYKIQAHTNISLLIIKTPTLKVVYQNIITVLKKSYEEILEENKELKRQVMRVVFTLQQYQALLLTAVIFASAGAGVGVIISYARTKSYGFGIEVLAGGYRKLAEEVTEEAEEEEEGGESEAKESSE